MSYESEFIDTLMKIRFDNKYCLNIMASKNASYVGSQMTHLPIPHHNYYMMSCRMKMCSNINTTILSAFSDEFVYVYAPTGGFGSRIRSHCVWY